MLLVFVKMVTVVFGLFMTRMLSEHFSVHDYGTYSQIILLSSTVSTFTIMGLVDGINYFFCSNSDLQKRKEYVSTIFFLQCAIGAFAALVILIGAVPISNYFGNEEVKNLIIFAALLPILQNSISLLQIMFIAIGKARLIAIRNLIVSIVKLIAILLACLVFDNIVVVLIAQVIMELAQIAYFVVSLHKNQCKIHLFGFKISLFKDILTYCIPMAMFTMVKALNRDCDKYVVAAFTDTETLAIYTNASKQLPFDLIMISFCTVLLPYITRYIAGKQWEKTQTLYKAFLELAYISTSILAIGAICVAPNLMTFLYTEKYLSGLAIFIVYIVVDILSVLNLTLLLSAAGKTKTIFYISLSAFALNLGLNILLFQFLGVLGPAFATLFVTVVQGLVMLAFSAKEINTSIWNLFDGRTLLVLVAEMLVMGLIACSFRYALVQLSTPSFFIMAICYSIFIFPLFAINFKKIKKCMGIINSAK